MENDHSNLNNENNITDEKQENIIPTQAAADFEQVTPGSEKGNEDIQKSDSLDNNKEEQKYLNNPIAGNNENVRYNQSNTASETPQYIQPDTGYGFSPPVQNSETGKPEDFVYKHSFYENPVGTENAANQQAAGFNANNPNMPDQTIPAVVPPLDNKKNEKTFKRGRLVISFACVILATSIITSAVSYSIWDHYGSKDQNNSSAVTSQNSSAGSSQASSSNNTSTISNVENGALTISQINKKVGPSVVFIGVEITSSNMFGQQGTESGSGSGIILSADGYILTNYHVIDGAKNITVKTLDEKSYPAKVVGKDSRTDLAIIKIDATGLTPATLGDSTGVEVGDLAVAIGNPLGTLDGTLTVGVISALDRSVTIDNVTMNLMQTDAAVNPGNSGGALANKFGEVIGIVNAKTSAVGIEGLGYAIPINDAKAVVDDLMKKGYVTGRLKIGITTKDITSDLKDYGLPVGIYVSAVESGSAAEKAGIQVKDIIIGVDGKEVTTSAALSAIKESHKVGDSIKILINRNGKEITVTLVFEQEVPALE